MRSLHAVFGCLLAGPGALLILLSLPGNSAPRSAPAQHIAVVLRDEQGQPINPHAAHASPYSPRATCGGCHPYDKITSAYHFTMGADELDDAWGAKHRNRPWMSSPGQNGGQQHMSYAWLGKKHNRTEAEVGLTTFAFAQTCAVCHPGGSLFERDRDGKRYDLRQQAQPHLAETFDGDYYKAKWDRSGVLEADCLMCHMPNYDMKARTEQLSKANYRWAATAGAGLAEIEGSVLAGDMPAVKYRPSVVTDGRLMVVPTRATDRNCLLCHGEAETKKRGHVWDGRNEDVHAKIACTSCHPTGADHQIAKGRSNAVFLRNDLDDPAVSCEGCHNSGRLGARRPAHSGIPASHLKKMTCAVCHVRDSNVTAVHVVDTTTGKSAGLPTSPEAKKYGESKAWRPAYFRLGDGRISAGNALLPSWWGCRVGNVIHPLTFAETGRAYETVRNLIRDDNGDGKPEANTEQEISAMLHAIAVTMQGGRFANVRPAYVKGHAVWEIRGGRLVSAAHPQAAPLRWTFSHNVSSARRALGAGGCGDCHGKPGGLFGSQVVTDPYDRNARPVHMPAWKYLRLPTPDPYATQQARRP